MSCRQSRCTYVFPSRCAQYLISKGKQEHPIAQSSSRFMLQLSQNPSVTAPLHCIGDDRARCSTPIIPRGPRHAFAAATQYCRYIWHAAPSASESARSHSAHMRSRARHPRGAKRNIEARETQRANAMPELRGVAESPRARERVPPGPRCAAPFGGARLHPVTPATAAGLSWSSFGGGARGSGMCPIRIRAPYPPD